MCVEIRAVNVAVASRIYTGSRIFCIDFMSTVFLLLLLFAVKVLTCCMVLWEFVSVSNAVSR